MLIGKNINLRRIEKVDLWQIWKWHEEDELYLFRKLKPFITWDELNEGFFKFFGWQGDFLIEDKRGKALGVSSYQNIYWKNRSCELALKVCESDQAFAFDAITILLSFLFDELNLARVNSFIPDFSTFEIQALEKADFVLEGKLREAVFLDEKYHDILVYAILKGEFQRGT
jgi:RimJ/RimL family protein N-acetyltransferase